MPIIPNAKAVRVFSGTNHVVQPNFFKGTNNLQTLDFDPFITGYAFIMWTFIPAWVARVYPGFATFTQQNFQSFGGLQDLDLATGTHQQGFAANEYHVATNLQKQNTDFTIKHAEFSGSPVRNMYSFWVTGIRDPETGIATYPRMFGVDYAARNHTAELLYVVTRPDANNTAMNNIEFAAYYTNVMPTKVSLSHLNFDLGSHDPTQIEIPFKGTLHMSPQVDSYAKIRLAQTYGFREESEFSPRDGGMAGSNINVGGAPRPDSIEGQDYIGTQGRTG